MYSLGAPLRRKDLTILHDAKLIGFEDILKATEDTTKVTVAAALDRYVLTTDMYMKRCEKAGMAHFGEISADDWKPASVNDFDEEFIAFIMGHHIRFCDLPAYKPFNLYISQATGWMSEDLPDLDELDDYEYIEHCRRERDRMKENSMYGLWRYIWYKESSAEGGEAKYLPTLAMWFLAFLIDSGYSAYLGKGRQIASTTTLAAIAIIKVITHVNFHAKLIACDMDTTTEIFEDKVKYSFSRLPFWAKPTVNNDKDNLFRVIFKRNANKGTRKGRSSKVAIIAPKLSAINGGAPDIVFVDEAPFLDIFDGMVREGRPTLFTTVNGRLVLKRQLWAWGTGGRSAKSGGSFEREHRKLFRAWQSGDYSSGIIPLFLDWTCRPNMTVELYESEHRAAMSGTGDGYTENDIEMLEIQFRQHYPSSIEDMYSIGSNTLLPPAFIMRNADKINALPRALRPKYGRFVPVFDYSTKNPPDSFFPHPIKSVQWVPAPEGTVDYCCMFMRPNNSYKMRYFQGTDPIIADEGLSNHASAIYDRHFRTIPCIVNMRANDPYIAYAQSKMMGMYYRNFGQEYCHETVESNIGKAYIKWMQGHEWRASRSLVTNYMLPDFMQGGSEPIGYDSKASRKRSLVDFGRIQTLAHGDNIYIPDYWTQHRTFISKTTSHNNVVHGVDDRKRHKDDVIDAVFMAMGTAMGFSGHPCVEVDSNGYQPGQTPPKRTKLVFDKRTRTNVRVLDIRPGQKKTFVPEGVDIGFERVPLKST